MVLGALGLLVLAGGCRSASERFLGLAAGRSLRAEVVTGAAGRRTLKVVCPHDCPDTCVMTVDVEDGRAVAIGGDPDHRFTQGFLCAKVNHYLERVYSPDRILHPMKRV